MGGTGSGSWQPFKKPLFQGLPVSKPSDLSFTCESQKWGVFQPRKPNQTWKKTWEY